jgi:cobyrinic acid a,c-diamide synthase
MSASAKCPALFIAAPSSGQGKTTVTAALARFFSRQGKDVRVFKTGPDYLDPQILAQASGKHVEQLDMWMAGEAYCQQKLYEAANEADLILVEGAMGLFDGEPSSADLASRFNIPVALLMDVKGMAQTAAAIAIGLANFRDDVMFAGLIANNCGSERHAQLIRDSLPAHLPLLGIFPRDEAVALPERHLGLVQPSEVGSELDARINHGADQIGESLQREDRGITELPEAVEFFAVTETVAEQSADLSKVKIAVAKDAAFTFIYDANIRFLRELGAQVCFFSPLNDKVLPEADALWFPGGYPELHAQQLSENSSMITSVREFSATNKPILSECGGFLYCLQSLTDLQDVTYPMVGILAGDGAMRGKRGCQGMQIAPLPEGEVRAHAHHRSRASGTPEPIAHGRRQRHAAPGEAIFRERGLTATYLHLFFPSNPEAVTQLFKPQQGTMKATG